MHVAVTRAEERLILSGAVELEKGWPAPAAGAAPLSWMGPVLLPDLGAISTAVPEGVREWTADGHAGRVRAVLNAPSTLGRVLRIGPGAPGEQLTLALGDAAEVPVEPPVEPPVEALVELPVEALAEPPVDAPSAPVLAPPAGVPRPPPPATLSYSSLTRYAACPYRFHLERHLGLPEQEPPPHLRDAEPLVEGLDPRLRGTLVHELLEALEPGAPAPGEEDVRAVAALHETELDDGQVADLLAMVRAFADSELSARLGAAASVRREHWFAFPLMADGPLVNGVADDVGLVVHDQRRPVRLMGEDVDDAVDERAVGHQREREPVFPADRRRRTEPGAELTVGERADHR